MTATSNTDDYETHPDVFEELGIYAEHLRNLVQLRWKEESKLHFEDRNLLLEGSPIHHKAVSIGRLANKAMGLQGMQIVCYSACMDACSQDGPGWSLDACQRDKLAIFELNLTWHGIGDWLR